MDAWKTKHPDYEDAAYRIDLTEQQGELWGRLREWPAGQSQDTDAITYGGAGAILLSRSGRIVAAITNAAQQTHDELLEITTRAFDSG